MKRLSLKVCGLTLAAGVLVLSANAQDDLTKKDSDKSEKKAATVKVERSPIKIEVTFKGVFEAAKMTEVSVKPDVWGALTVLKAVEPGTKVKAGDVLVEFDPEKIDKAIRDMESEQKLAELSLRLAELDPQLAQKSMPLELAAAERALKNAREDYQKFLDVDKKQSIESVEFGVKSSQNMLENQKEELKQLEKMYRSKDLTEETEEIILKRQKFAVESAEFFLKSFKLRRDQTLAIDLPRREKEMHDTLERAEIALTKTKNVVPMSVEQKKLNLEKAKYERTRAQEKFANLKKDRNLFTVKAPTDGIVYYGKCVQGNWSSSATKLQKGSTVMADEVFITIVKASPMFIRATVDEKDCRVIAPNQPCKITAPAYPDARMTGEIDTVASVPVGGNYEVKVKLNPTDIGVVPGMNCQVKVVTYEKAGTLTVPAYAVFTDELDEEKTYVYKPVPGGKPEKVTVKVGKKSAGKAEILSGLADGDEILKDKP